MAALNKFTGIGNLVRDPEQHTTQTGMVIVSFTIAINWRGKDGKEGAEYVRCVVFGKLAEIAAKYLKKGSQVYVEGRLRTNKWEKDGQTHYTTEVVLSEMQFLGKKENGSNGSNAAQEPDNYAPAADLGWDDDCPF
jgi:single-strand DNA-binding protein